MMTPELERQLQGTDAAINTETARALASQRRWENAIKIGSAAIAGGAGIASMAGAGGAAGAGTLANVSGTTSSGLGAGGMWGGGAGVASGGASMASRIPWLQVGSKAADTLFGVYANRQQQGANREALAYQERADVEARRIEAEERAEQKRQFDLQQAELKRQWDANQRFEADKFAASEDERLYTQRLADEREARRAPYREASAAALARIPGILASGRTSPGMGSLGSYKGGR